jgi:hypothetical protein
MAYEIEARPVTYMGVHFRSMLEARWAVALDRMGDIYAWEYEPQGFMLPSCGVPGCDRHPSRPYLPDFYLSGLGIWVEVKGPAAALDLALIEWASHCLRGWHRWTQDGSAKEGAAAPLGDGSDGILVLGPLSDRAPWLVRGANAYRWAWHTSEALDATDLAGSSAILPDAVDAEDLLYGWEDDNMYAPITGESPAEIVDYARLFDEWDDAPRATPRRPLIHLPRPDPLAGCIERCESAGHSTSGHRRRWPVRWPLQRKTQLQPSDFDYDSLTREFVP